MREVKHHVASSESGRLIPSIILGLSLLLCVGYVFATSTTSRPGAAADDGVAELERKIAGGSAGAETWMAYAGILESRGQFDYAAEAYRRVLELAPFERTAQMELSVCLARTGSDHELKELLQDLAVNDAKLAVEIMGRQELGPYMAGSDFGEILEEARDQAND